MKYQNPLNPYNRFQPEEYLSYLPFIINGGHKPTNNPIIWGEGSDNVSKQDYDDSKGYLYDLSKGSDQTIGKIEDDMLPRGNYVRKNNQLYVNGKKLNLETDTYDKKDNFNEMYAAFAGLDMLGDVLHRSKQNKEYERRYQMQRSQEYLPTLPNLYGWNENTQSFQTGGESQTQQDSPDLWNYLTPMEKEEDLGYDFDQIERTGVAKDYQEALQSPEYASEPVTISESVNEKSKYARDYLVNRGLTKEDASAVIGNLIQESNLKTNADGDGGTSLGIAQWHKTRKQSLLKYANDYGRDPYSLDTQLDFLLTEPKWSDYIYHLSKFPTIEEKTKYFSEKYERPSKPMMNNRIGYAKSVLNLK